MKRTVLCLLWLICPFLTLMADLRQENDPEARRTFEKAYNLVYGPEGCSLRYDVNLIGIYKTHGSIWIKQKKSKFSDERLDSWCDGTTVYNVHRKKKTIEIFDANSDKRDKYASKFKFSLDDFDYTMQRQGEVITINLRQKRGARGTVKEARVVVDAATLYPQQIKVKVALFWGNIKISNFKSGNIPDATFVFPRQNYTTGYRYVDKR